MLYHSTAMRHSSKRTGTLFTKHALTNRPFNDYVRSVIDMLTGALLTNPLVCKFDFINASDIFIGLNFTEILTGPLANRCNKLPVQLRSFI